MGKSRSIIRDAMRWASGRSPLWTNTLSDGSPHALGVGREANGTLSMLSCRKTQKGGMMSSLKFSY